MSISSQVFAQSRKETVSSPVEAAKTVSDLVDILINALTEPGIKRQWKVTATRYDNDIQISFDSEIFTFYVNTSYNENESDNWKLCLQFDNECEPCIPTSDGWIKEYNYESGTGAYKDFLLRQWILPSNELYISDIQPSVDNGFYVMCEHLIVLTHFIKSREKVLQKFIKTEPNNQVAIIEQYKYTAYIFMKRTQK